MNIIGELEILCYNYRYRCDGRVRRQQFTPPACSAGNTKVRHDTSKQQYTELALVA